MNYQNQTWMKLLPPFIRTRLDGQHGLQNIISNIGWLSAERILRMGVSIVVAVWVARYLGADQFGIYNYVIAFVTLFSPLAKLGLDEIIVRDIVRVPSHKEDILGTGFVLKLTGGIATCLLTLAAIGLVRPGDSFMTLLVGLVAVGVVFQAFDIIDLWFQAQVQSKYVVWVRSSAFILIALSKVVLIQMQAPLIAFVAVTSFEFAIIAVGFVIVYRLNGNALRIWRISWARARALLNNSWPLILSAVLVTIYLRIDQIMLGQMVGEVEVGLYSAAVLLGEAWYFIPVAIVTSMFPSIVESKEIDETLFYAKLQKLYNLMAFLGYVVALPTTFLAGWIITLLFGAMYSSAAPMLAVLIWAGLFVNLGVARTSFIVTMNWTKISFMTLVVGAGVNVLLNYLLIPPYGGVGSAIASLVAYWAAVHFACFLYKPLFRTGIMLTKALMYPRIW